MVPGRHLLFRGGGFSSHFKHGTKGGIPMTMARMNIVKGLGPVLQIAEGYSCELEPDVFEKSIREQTPRGLRHFLPRDSQERALSRMFTASWPIGEPITELSATAISGRT